MPCSFFKRWLCENCLHCWLNAACFVGGDQGLLNMYFRDWATKDIARHLPFIYNVVSQAFYSYLPAFTQWVLILKCSSWFIIEYSPLPNKASLPSLHISCWTLFLHKGSLYWLKLISLPSVDIDIHVTELSLKQRQKSWKLMTFRFNKGFKVTLTNSTQISWTNSQILVTLLIKAIWSFHKSKEDAFINSDELGNYSLREK